MNENINLKKIPLKELVKLALEETPIIKAAEVPLDKKPRLQRTREKIIEVNAKQLEVMRKRAEEQRNSRAIRYMERDQVLSANERDLKSLMEKLRKEGKIL